MIELYVDFDAIREQAIDYIFAGAGHIAGLVETAIDKVESVYESFPDTE